jgi:hypothetical protein
MIRKPVYLFALVFAALAQAQSRTLYVPVGAPIQPAIDALANGTDYNPGGRPGPRPLPGATPGGGQIGQGGTIVLARGATYTTGPLKMPWTPDLRYRNIRIVGDATRIVGPADGHVLAIGDGAQNYSDPKLVGVALMGLDFYAGSDHCPGVLVQMTDRAVVDDCGFYDFPYEAFVTGGATTTLKTRITYCYAEHCGWNWPYGPLAGYNLNGWGDMLLYSTAIDCGWGAEIGGTGTRVLSCAFFNSQVAIGSGVFGVSDIEIASSYFSSSAVGMSNGIGKLGDIRIHNNVFDDGGVYVGGGLDHNIVQLPDLPYSSRRSVVANNTFSGDGFTMNQWEYDLATPPLLVAGNVFDCGIAREIVFQSYIDNPVEFTGNTISQVFVGMMHCYKPGGGDLPDDSDMLFFHDNPAPEGAYIQVLKYYGDGHHRILVN